MMCGMLHLSLDGMWPFELIKSSRETARNSRYLSDLYPKITGDSLSTYPQTPNPKTASDSLRTNIF